MARGVGFGDPQNHCALNVALYGRSGKYWTLTERTRRDLHRQTNTIQIGPSRLDWDGKTLTVFIDEVTVPFPSRVLGTVRVRPQALTKRAFALDTQGRHCWHPIAPCAEIEVAMQHPSLRWSGRAYWDCNFGDEPLEAAFQEWDWTRAKLGDSTTVLYDITPHRAPPYTLALRFDPNGTIDTFQPPPRAALDTTYWRVRRHARSDDGRPSVLQTLEDTPFYARSLIAAHILGTKTLGMHESLSLKRVANPVVRAMLPFRMPRRRWRRR
jgi:carotenoid 1,2-hydratase